METDLLKNFQGSFTELSRNEVHLSLTNDDWALRQNIRDL